MKAAIAAVSEFAWNNAALQCQALFEEMGAVDVLARSQTESVALEPDMQVG